MTPDLSNLPSEGREFIIRSLEEHGLSTSDPICALVYVQSLIMERDRRRRTGAILFWMLACGSIAAACGFSGFYYGQWKAGSEVYKARPMVTINTPGNTIVYGTQAGHGVIRIDAADAWTYEGNAYVRFK